MIHFNKLVRQLKAKKGISPADFFQEYEVNLDEEYYSNKTMLQNAIIERDNEIINAILNINDDCVTKRHNLNTPDHTNRNWAALHYAAFESSTEGIGTVQSLLLVFTLA